MHSIEKAQTDRPLTSEDTRMHMRFIFCLSALDSLCLHTLFMRVLGNYPNSLALSNRVRNINKLMIDTEAARQIVAERLHAKTFGRMVTACEISNTRLARKMHCLL